MTTISEEQAGSQLPGLIDLALQGEEIVITRHERPIMQLVPVEDSAPVSKPEARFGSGKGSILYMAQDFNAPLEDFQEYME